MKYLHKNLSMYHNIHYKYQRTTSSHLPRSIVEHSAGRVRRGRLVWGKHGLVSGGPGGYSFSKERLDDVNGIQLGVACDGREV